MNQPWANIEEVNSAHALTSFRSGSLEVDKWFKTNSLAQQKMGRVRTKVCVADNKQVVAFFSFKMIVIEVQSFSKSLQKSANSNSAGQSTGLLLAWMGRDETVDNCGKALMREVFLHAITAHKIAAYSLLVVDALSDNLVSFYEHFGFRRVPSDTRRLVMKASALLKIAERLN